MKLKVNYESIIKQLPQPKSIQEERQERITEMATRRRIERRLEKIFYNTKLFCNYSELHHL